MPHSRLYAYLITFVTCVFAGLPTIMSQELKEDCFILYTQQDGLPHNTITGMVQDSTGYIWFSNLSGLYRFNGSHFFQMYGSTDSIAKAPEFIRGLKWIDDHRMVAYSAGLLIVDMRTGASRNLYIPYGDKKYQYKFNGVRSVQGAPNGDIYLSTNSGFYHFDRNYRLVFRFDYYKKDQLASEGFSFGRELLWIDSSRLLLVSIDGLYTYDIRQCRLMKMRSADCPVMSRFMDYPAGEYMFYQHRPGRLFVLQKETDSIWYVNMAANSCISTSHPFKRSTLQFGFATQLVQAGDTVFYLTGQETGFYKMSLDPSGRQVRFYPKKYFPGYFCHQLLRDHDDNLWIATSKGLLRQDHRLSRVHKTSLSSMLQEKYPNIAIDDTYLCDEKLFVATRGNGGLLEYDKRDLRFIRRFSFSQSFKTSDNIFSMLQLSDTDLLVATNGPLFRLNMRTGRMMEVPLIGWDREHDWAASIFKDRKGNIWTAANHLYKRDANTRKFEVVHTAHDPFSRIQEISNFAEDKDGNIWMSGHGLFRYNCKLGDFDKLVDSFSNMNFPDRRVQSLSCDRHNNLWIANFNNGLTCYNIGNGEMRRFTRTEGLPDNNISTMIALGDKLWIATYSGISCLDMRSMHISSFGKEDGFPDQSIPHGARFSYDTARNRLYIGFSSSIVQFDPDIIFQRTKTPHFFIERISSTYEKETLYPTGTVTLSWKDNDIRLTIGSVNYITGANQRFSYRLVQEEHTPWQDLGAMNVLNISNLSPGQHRIQVKLSSPDNRWPEQVKQLDINILPPFWKQGWFLILLILLLLLSVVALIRWRTELTRRKEQAKTHIQRLKAEEYKKQFELEQISNYFSSCLAHKKDVDEVLWDVARNLIGRMKYTDCMIYLWNETKTRMVQKASYGPKGNSKAIDDKVFDVMPGQGVVGHVMQTWEPLLIADTRKEPKYRVDDIRRLSEICVPIIHNNELIGVIDSEHPTSNYYKERDLQILTTIATLVGNKIKQIESEQFLDQQQKEIVSVNQQLAEAQLSALQTQMNPHFIFNSLNSIKGMILENQQIKASRYLSKFAHMIRITLNQSKEIFTTLYENLEYLESYLMMEKLRFDDSFTFRISVDGQIDKEETLIPTMMIQPLAENAIWHGLMPKKGDKQLAIRFSKMEENICCTISDNGIGIKKAEELKRLTKPPHQSVGLTNLRNRIKIMNEKYDSGCSLDIIDLNDLDKDKTGTRVVLQFKIITTKPCL